MRIHITLLLSKLNTCCEKTESSSNRGSAVPRKLNIPMLESIYNKSMCVVKDGSHLNHKNGCHGCSIEDRFHKKKHPYIWVNLKLEMLLTIFNGT